MKRGRTEARRTTAFASNAPVADAADADAAVADAPAAFDAPAAIVAVVADAADAADAADDVDDAVAALVSDVCRILADSDDRTQSMAVGFMQEMGPVAFLPHVVAFVHMIVHPDLDVRHAAFEALGNLRINRTKMRHHWATARAFVKVYLVRPYALFWYEYVGKPLCAPGGKWSVRDRTAFVDDFGALGQ